MNTVRLHFAAFVVSVCAVGVAQSEAPHLRVAPTATPASVPTAVSTPQADQASAPPATPAPVLPGLSDYAGMLDGNAAVHFTLIGGVNGAVTGSYFLASDLVEHPFTGKVIDANSFSARVADATGPGASPYLYLKVEKSHGSGNWLSGALYGASDSNQHSVAISLKSSAPAVTSEADRYAVAGAKDAASVESNAHAFWQAVIATQPADAAALVAYPLAYTENGRRTLLHTPAEFQSKFAEIFTPAFVAELKTTVPKAMTANERGISLGNGKVLFDASGRAFAVDNDTVKMFAGKKFLSNAGWVRGASQSGKAAGGETNGGASKAAATSAGQRHPQRRSRRRRSPPAGGNN